MYMDSRIVIYGKTKQFQRSLDTRGKTIYLLCSRIRSPYHMIFLSSKSNTSGSGTANPSEALAFIPFIVKFVLLNLEFSVQQFVDNCLLFCPFSFGHCVVCSSMYSVLLPLWYLQSFFVFIWTISQFVKHSQLRINTMLLDIDYCNS